MSFSAIGLVRVVDEVADLTGLNTSQKSSAIEWSVVPTDRIGKEMPSADDSVKRINLMFDKFLELRIGVVGAGVPLEPIDLKSLSQLQANTE